MRGRYQPVIADRRSLQPSDDRVNRVGDHRENHGPAVRLDPALKGGFEIKRLMEPVTR